MVPIEQFWKKKKKTRWEILPEIEGSTGME